MNPIACMNENAIDCFKHIIESADDRKEESSRYNCMGKSDIKDRIKHAIETADDRKEESSFGKIRYCCMGCNKSYSNKKSLSRYYKRKECDMFGTRPHKCEKCEKILSSYKSLQRHKKMCERGDASTDLTRVESEDGKAELTPNPVLQTEDKTSKRRTCNKCLKTYSCRQALSYHKRNSRCGIIITLKWNGKCWETKDTRYRLNHGRDLSALLERGAIKEEALNSTQKEYVQMYKTLFMDDL